MLFYAPYKLVNVAHNVTEVSALPTSATKATYRKNRQNIGARIKNVTDKVVASANIADFFRYPRTYCPLNFSTVSVCCSTIAFPIFFFRPVFKQIIQRHAVYFAYLHELVEFGRTLRAFPF